MLDTIGDLKRMESLTIPQQTPAQTANRKNSRSSLEKIRIYYQKHKKFFDTIGIVNALIAWIYAAFIAWLIVTLIILIITQKLYSNGTWPENDVWLIVLLVGITSGMVSAIISFMGSILYRIPSIILNACSVGLLGSYTAYQAYKVSPISKIIKDPQDLVTLQFYLAGLIISVILYLIIVSIILLLRYLVNKYKGRNLSS